MHQSWECKSLFLICLVVWGAQVHQWWFIKKKNSCITKVSIFCRNSIYFSRNDLEANLLLIIHYFTHYSYISIAMPFFLGNSLSFDSATGKSDSNFPTKRDSLQPNHSRNLLHTVLQGSLVEIQAHACFCGFVSSQVGRLGLRPCHFLAWATTYYMFLHLQGSCESMHNKVGKSLGSEATSPGLNPSFYKFFFFFFLTSWPWASALTSLYLFPHL